MTGKEIDTMANIQESLDSALDLDGAIGAALADHSSGMCLGTAGGSKDFDLEVAAAGNSEVVRSKMRVMESLKISDTIEDILITLGTEYHVILLIPGGSLFLYIALRRDRSNLALTRHKMQAIAKDLQL